MRNTRTCKCSGGIGGAPTLFDRPGIQNEKSIDAAHSHLEEAIERLATLESSSSTAEEAGGLHERDVEAGTDAIHSIRPWQTCDDEDFLTVQQSRNTIGGGGAETG